MTRYTMKYEVDSIRDGDILDIEREFKRQRRYNPAVRDGLRIMYNLMVEDNLMILFKIDQLHNKSAIKDMQKALNLLLAIEGGDMEYIFNHYPFLIKKAVQYLGVGGSTTYQPTQEDFEVIENKPVDIDKAFLDFIS